MSRPAIEATPCGDRYQYAAPDESWECTREAGHGGHLHAVTRDGVHLFGWADECGALALVSMTGGHDVGARCVRLPDHAGDHQYATPDGYVVGTQPSEWRK